MMRCREPTQDYTVTWCLGVGEELDFDDQKPLLLMQDEPVQLAWVGLGWGHCTNPTTNLFAMAENGRNNRGRTLQSISRTFRESEGVGDFCDHSRKLSDMVFLLDPHLIGPKLCGYLFGP